MKQKIVYRVINIIVLLLTGILFLNSYSDMQLVFSHSISGTIIVLVVTAILVHVIKAFRLYFALYGKGIKLSTYVRQYCKVVPVSMILPFKLGDVFRAYCYGYQIQNYFSGILVILFDRFMDTLALVTVIFLMQMISSSGVMPVFYLLFVFLVGVIICYMVFPGMYKYWKRYFLKAKASKRRNNMLKILERLNDVYAELKIVAKGRGMILYLLSVGAWAVEIGGIAVSNKLLFGQGTVMAISEYLTSVLAGPEVAYLKQFICVSIVLMIVFYLILYTVGLFRKKGGEE